MTTEHLDAPESGRATEPPPAQSAEPATEAPVRQTPAGEPAPTALFPLPRTGGDPPEPGPVRRPRGRRAFAALLAADCLAAGATCAAPGVTAGGHLLTVLVPGLLTLTVLNARGGLYRPTALTGALDELPALLGHIAAIWCVLATALAATWPAHALGWSTLAGLAATHSALACAARAAVHGVRRAAARHRPAPTLVVGRGPVARRLVDALREHPEYGMRPVGVLHPAADGPDDARWDAGEDPLPLLVSRDSVLRAVAQDSVRDAVFTDPGTDEARTAELFRLLTGQGCTVWLLDLPASDALPLGHRPLTGPVRAPAAAHLWGFRCHRVVPLGPHASGRLRKRALDLVVAVVALLFAAPLLVACALAVRWADGPGVLFRQERVGQDGRPFVLLKFRTLRPADTHESATLWSIANDERMSGVGRTLRRTSLDELPQLWNVVRGDMSLVGPRPERPHFVQRFSLSYPRYAARHRMPGGVTGLAQVHGLRGDTSIEDRARFDNHYIDTWSLWQDVRILLRTAASLFRPAGS
ncbi:sugar transferase [Streptomyces axinellae]|uniref:Exopolysaccharide biosynthesis polyprenyl glycosylphosphotransferase n=1 Tax=Streptomyces axinellae TaxID=552788 RepID=A0ABP6CCQ2_9ACTN